jgi:hypothetical protein
MPAIELRLAAAPAQLSSAKGGAGGNAFGIRAELLDPH